MTLRQFFAFSYTLMAEEAGGCQAIEKVLEDWVVAEKFRQMSATHSVNWDDADRMALSLING